MSECIVLKLVTFLALCTFIYTLWLSIRFDVLKGVRFHKSTVRT